MDTDRIDGHMNRLTHGQTDSYTWTDINGWTHGQMARDTQNGHTDRQNERDGQTDRGHTDRWPHGQTDGHMDRRIYGQTDTRTDGHTDRRTDTGSF